MLKRNEAECMTQDAGGGERRTRGANALAGVGLPSGRAGGAHVAVAACHVPRRRVTGAAETGCKGSLRRPSPVTATVSW